MRWLAWGVIVLAAIVVALHACLLGLEDRLLWRPRTCRSYSHYETGPKTRWRWLPSGALVVTLEPPSATRRRHQRELLFCHGRRGTLDDFEAVAKRLACHGYRVCMLEYAGFGATASRPTKSTRIVRTSTATAESVMRDAREAWRLCIRKPRRAILAGFSLGGGAVAQLLACLPARRLPAQVVLINTFYSLPDVIRDTVPCAGLLARFMKTRWCAQAGLTRFAAIAAARAARRPRSWPDALIVATKDDTVIDARHARQLEACLESSPGAAVALVWLPGGGHGHGPSLHWDMWSAVLAPPRTNRQHQSSSSRPLSPILAADGHALDVNQHA